VPDNQSPLERWSEEAKLAFAAEMLVLSEIDMDEYCRRKGLFPEQVKSWRAACLSTQRQAASLLKRKPKRLARTRGGFACWRMELKGKDRTPAKSGCSAGVEKKLNAFYDEKNGTED
jgi:hypothetical protein